MALGLMFFGEAIIGGMTKFFGGSLALPLALLLVLGQTAFFFYLLHPHLLLLAAWSLGVSHQRGLPETFIATAAVIGLLYPCCRWYRGYKTVHPNGWARYI